MRPHAPDLPMTQDPLRVAVIADLLEEGWPSMDLVAEMLMTELGTDSAVRPALLRMPLTRRLSWPDRNGRLLTMDRIVNRYWDYARWLRANPPAADVHHIVDHSYAHLASHLPAGRVVVTCHDTDAFRTVLTPERRESSLPGPLVRRTLRGIRRAAVVACVSRATRDEMARHALVDEARLVVVRNGVHPSCTEAPDADADAEAGRRLGSTPDGYLLHVGSTIGRKRVDVLLEIFRRLATARPDLRLVRAGGRLTDEQSALVARYRLTDRIVHLPFVSRQVLAAVYRRAAMVLLPSDREGFGLPVIEALACGTPVVASDLPVLREVGGLAVEYCSAGDVDAWQQTVALLLDQRHAHAERWEARRRAGIQRAAMFSWKAFAAQMTEIYGRVAADATGGALR
jgi:glycosyltransferase involved in cell wall biosynthesis